MKMNSNPVEDELDAIRIRHYEQTKDMTTDEYVAYVNNRTEVHPSKTSKYSLLKG